MYPEKLRRILQGHLVRSKNAIDKLKCIFFKPFI